MQFHVRKCRSSSDPDPPESRPGNQTVSTGSPIESHRLEALFQSLLEVPLAEFSLFGSGFFDLGVRISSVWVTCFGPICLRWLRARSGFRM